MIGLKRNLIEIQNGGLIREKHAHLQPQIPKQESGADTHWMCKRCTDSQPRTREPCEPKTSMVKASIRKVCSGRDQPQPPPDDMTKLPYDVRSNI